MRLLPIYTAAIAASAVLAVGPAMAEYPDKEITMIVNAGAGGSTSAGARILAQAMEKTLGQPIVVVSKPGGSGTKGALVVRKAKADGYTIGYSYTHVLAFGPRYKRKKASVLAQSVRISGIDYRPPDFHRVACGAGLDHA